MLQISYVPQPMNRLVQRVIAATSLHEFCGRWDGLDVESVVSGDNLLCRHGKFVETQRWWGLHVWMLLTREMDLPYSEAADLCQTNVLPMSRSKLEESIRGLILSAVAQHYWARMHLHHNGKHQGTFRL